MFSKFVTNIFTNMIFNFGFEINFINLVDFFEKSLYFKNNKM